MDRSSPSAAPRPRLAFLEGIRAVAALVVVWNHVFAEVYPLAYGVHVLPPFESLDYLRVIGHFSVTVFIALSGFCLMLPQISRYESEPLDIRRFFQRRARRILPTYYLALIFCLVMIKVVFKTPAGLHFDFSTHLRTSDILSHFVLLQNVFGTGTINYVFWSIATEWQIYFLFPLLLRGFRKLTPTHCTFIALSLGYIASALINHTRLDRMSVHYVGVFALGMLAALAAYGSAPWCQQMRRNFPTVPVIIVGVGALTSMVLRLGWRNCEPYRPYHDLVVAAIAFSLLLHASRPGLVQRIFSWKPLEFLGTFSYSVYLMHVPFLALLLKYVVKPMHLERFEEFVLVSTVGLIPILAASYLFYLVAERPFLNKR